jgi:hypothetical protein
MPLAMTRRLGAIVLLAALTMSAGPVLAASAPPLLGHGACAWGSDDCNVCVADVVDSVARLRNHGDILGFHMNGFPDPSMSRHWEGVQRTMSGDGRYLAISRRIPDEGDDIAVAIVEMASRNDLGLRMRSNRLDPLRFFELTPPPLEDGIVAAIPHEPGYLHAGGMQLLGNILAVPFEEGPSSKVVFYDVTEPLLPIRLGEIDHGDLSSNAGTATLTKLADGRFVLVIGGFAANDLDFYVSAGSNLRAPGFELFDRWNESEIETELCGPFGCSCDAPLPLPGTDCEFGDYQTLNFVNQCDGTLFMVGTHASLGGGFGDDFIDVFRVENAAGDAVRVTKVGKRHAICTYRDVNNCQFDAAAGTYVDPGGQLYVVATEHDNDGPIEGFIPPSPGAECSGAACSVKVEEFRPVPHASCTHIRDAWVELYDDVEPDRDRSLMIDFVDRQLENYANYDHVEDFEDRASSVLWCLPEGASYRLWEHKEPCGGSFRDLIGTGAPVFLNLQSVSFGDLTSCSEWRGGPFADAGADQTVECAAPTTTSVALDGTDSVAAEGGELGFLWDAAGVVFDDASSATPTGAFPKGTTSVTLTVTQGTAVSSDTVEIHVADRTPPAVSCPSDAVIECSAAGGANEGDPTVQAFLAGVTATDACDASVSIANDLPDFVGLGSIVVTFTASDDDGNSASCQANVTVEDTTAPAIASLVLAPSVLVPPDHRLVPIDVSPVVATEVCDPEPRLFCSVASSEVVDGLGDGTTLFDIVFDGVPIATQQTGVREIASDGGVGDFGLVLRAERSGLGLGRTYTAACFGTDASGNQGAPRTATVVVPR